MTFGLVHGVQVLIFCKSIGMGMLLGAYCMLFVLIRRIVAHGFTATLIEDMLVLISCAVFTFCFLFTFTAGVGRLYIFFGELAGFILSERVLRVLFSRIPYRRHKKQ